MEWKTSLDTPSTASGWAVTEEMVLFCEKKHGEKPVVWDNLTIYVLIAIPFLDCVGLLQNRAQNNTSL